MQQAPPKVTQGQARGTQAQLAHLQQSSYLYASPPAAASAAADLGGALRGLWAAAADPLRGLWGAAARPASVRPVWPGPSFWGGPLQAGGGGVVQAVGQASYHYAAALGESAAAWGGTATHTARAAARRLFG